ncbi:MAG: hypothetical protein R2867_17835 [Caldilineaceae bacterium]
MEQAIKDLYHPAILQEAMQRYGIINTHAQPRIGRNFVYAFERDAQGTILRISHSLRRSAALIQGEVDWINYLAEGGVAVAKGAPLCAGNWWRRLTMVRGTFSGDSLCQSSG